MVGSCLSGCSAFDASRHGGEWGLVMGMGVRDSAPTSHDVHCGGGGHHDDIHIDGVIGMALSWVS